MTPAPDSVPDDIPLLRAALVAEQLARREAEARASGAEAMVAHLKLLIAKLKHDHTTVPVLAKGKTVTGRLWTYVRDDQPFGGPEPPAAVFYYSRDRGGEHPRKHLAGYAGILQADAYAGFNGLFHEGRKPGPVTEAGCWAHGRRKLFDLAKLARAPLGPRPCTRSSSQQS